MDQSRFVEFCKSLIGKRVGFSRDKVIGVQTEDICPKVSEHWGTDVLILMSDEVWPCPLCTGEHEAPHAMYWSSSWEVTLIASRNREGQKSYTIWIEKEHGCGGLPLIGVTDEEFMQMAMCLGAEIKVRDALYSAQETRP